MKKLTLVLLLFCIAISSYAQGIDPKILKGAEAGDPVMQTKLGVIYGNLEKYKDALIWFNKAAAQGYPNAQYNLGSSYYNGELGIPDPVTGCAWIYLSKEQQGSVLCDKALSQAQMTRTLHLIEQLKQNIK